MPEFVEANWPFLLIAALLIIALLWFLIAANRKTSVVAKEAKDVLDEGAAPAARNQALIDASSKPEAPQVSVAGPEPTPEAIPAQAPAPASAPAPAPAAAQAAPPSTDGDDLTVIKGLGPKLASLLNSLGITTYAQIAGWDDAEIDRIDSQLDRFAGRIRRDNWVEQAKLLTSGDESAFSDKFGQNG